MRSWVKNSANEAVNWKGLDYWSPGWKHDPWVISLFSTLPPCTQHWIISPHTATKSHLCIPFLGIVRPQSQIPHSCDCERFIYSQDRSTYNISCSRIGRSIVGIYKSLTDTWMWKLGLWPRNSQKRIICFEFSVLVLCSALMDHWASTCILGTKVRPHTEYGTVSMLSNLFKNCSLKHRAMLVKTTVNCWCRRNKDSY